MARCRTRWNPSVGWVSRSSFDDSGQLRLELVELGAARAQHLGGRGVLQQREQEMLHGHELVAFLSRLAQGDIQREFELLTEHDSSRAMPLLFSVGCSA
jgi:hypothetical protein